MDAQKSLDKEINNYLGHLNVHQKEVVLSVVKTFAGEEDDWWEGVEAAAQESIQRGIKQISEGKTTPNAEVMKKYDKWLSK
jgi:predicted transcriptional regulator